jgi:hypothetical protein
MLMATLELPEGLMTIVNAKHLHVGQNEALPLSKREIDHLLHQYVPLGGGEGRPDELTE